MSRYSENSRILRRIPGALFSLAAGWIAYFLLVGLLSPTCRHIMLTEGFFPGVTHTAQLSLRGIRAAGPIALFANLGFALAFLLSPRSMLFWGKCWAALLFGGLAGAVCGIAISLFYGEGISMGVILFTAPAGMAASLAACLFEKNSQSRAAWPFSLRRHHAASTGKNCE